MSTLRLPLRRRHWYQDHDGVWTRTKREDEVLSETIDFADQLGSGETLSSVTVHDSGPTISSEAVSGTELTYTVTKTGSVTFRVVTSDSRTLEVELHYRSLDGYATDYGK